MLRTYSAQLWKKHPFYVNFWTSLALDIRVPPGTHNDKCLIFMQIWIVNASNI